MFCKSLGFRLIKNNQLENLDQVPLKIIISQAKKIASLITSFVFSIDLITTTFITFFTSHLTLMKLMAIFIIIYR